MVRSPHRPGTHRPADFLANIFSRQTESFKHLFGRNINLNRLWDLRLLPGMSGIFRSVDQILQLSANIGVLIRGVASVDQLHA